jgi:hypothetical protein
VVVVVVVVVIVLVVAVVVVVVAAVVLVVVKVLVVMVVVVEIDNIISNKRDNMNHLKIIQKISENQLGKRDCKELYTAHCTHTLGSAYVKVRTVYHGK